MQNSFYVKVMGAVGSIALTLLLWFIPSGSLLNKFMPRSKCMFYESNLIGLHAIADTIIFISYVIIASCLLGIYRIVQEKQIPLKGFLWMFGVFIFLCGLTHAMGVLNLWISYYWLDGAIKALCAVFSLFTAALFFRAPSILKDLYIGTEYKELQEQYRKLQERVSLLEKGIL